MRYRSVQPVPPNEAVVTWIWFCLPFLTFWRYAKACSTPRKARVIADMPSTSTKTRFEVAAWVPTNTATKIVNDKCDWHHFTKARNSVSRNLTFYTSVTGGYVGTR